MRQASLAESGIVPDRVPLLIASAVCSQEQAGRGRPLTTMRHKTLLERAEQFDLTPEQHEFFKLAHFAQNRFMVLAEFTEAQRTALRTVAEEWLAGREQRSAAGASTSNAKAEAARENGKRGGRPKKQA